MRKAFHCKIVILVTVVFLIVLTGHFHLHDHHGADESHCPFCVLLNTGMIFGTSFKLPLCLGRLIAVAFITAVAVNAVKIFHNQLRAPPFLMDCHQSLSILKMEEFRCVYIR